MCPCGISLPSQFCIICRVHILLRVLILVKVHASPSSRSSMKMSNRTGPSVEPILPVTGFQLNFVTTLWAQPFSQFSVLLIVCSTHPHINTLSMGISCETALKSLDTSRQKLSTPLPPVQASHFFIGLCKVGEAWLPLSKTVLTAPGGFPVIYVSGNYFQG